MRDFLSIPFAPYAGGYTSKAFNDARGKQKGLMVPLAIKWDAYSVNGAPLGNAHSNFSVVFDLNAAGPNTVSIGWTIHSVYIDNLGVDFPVYVYFSDTQFPIVAPPNTGGWFQVFTNARQGLVIAEGISSASTGQKTGVYFTDVSMVPYIDYELATAVSLFRASPSIQRTSAFPNTAFAAAALGDQSNQAGIPLTGQNSAPVFSGVTPRQPSGFYYLTAISIYVTNPSALAATTGNVQIRSPDLGLTIFDPTFFAPVAADVEKVPGNFCILQLTGMQLKLDATVAWDFINLVTIQTGIGECFVVFTYQP